MQEETQPLENGLTLHLSNTTSCDDLHTFFPEDVQLLRKRQQSLEVK